MQPIGSYGWAYGPPIPKDQDSPGKLYKDLRGEVEVIWATSFLKVNFPPAMLAKEKIGFTSQVAIDKYKATTSRFNANEFHFHTPSEHTVNGKHLDLELHTMHKAESSDEVSRIKFATIAIFFSVEDYDRDISQTQN